MSTMQARNCFQIAASQANDEAIRQIASGLEALCRAMDDQDRKIEEVKNDVRRYAR
jgi:hypothetical protein